MNLGGRISLLTATAALVGGCAAAPKDVEVRRIADPAAATTRGGDELAAARGQFALGNIGLALEAFRKIQRNRPSDPAPLAGIGDCYAAMGRLDIAQSNYEAALALAPESPALLTGLANVLELEGQHARAVNTRLEAASAAMAAGLVPTASLTVARSDAGMRNGAPLSASITVKLPPARAVEPASETIVGGLADLHPANSAPLSSTITVALPPAKSAGARDALPAKRLGPHLERLSPGEVALVTSRQSLWRSKTAARTVSGRAARWKLLSPSESRPNVQVLNAARVRNLAASARTILLDRGWRKITVGDAASVQEKSVVLYPRASAALARSLAAQFGIATRMVEGDFLVLVLGSDKARTISGGA